MKLLKTSTPNNYTDICHVITKRKRRKRNKTRERMRKRQNGNCNKHNHCHRIILHKCNLSNNTTNINQEYTGIWLIFSQSYNPTYKRNCKWLFLRFFFILWESFLADFLLWVWLSSNFDHYQTRVTPFLPPITSTKNIIAILHIDEPMGIHNPVA